LSQSPTDTVPADSSSDQPKPSTQAGLAVAPREVLKMQPSPSFLRDVLPLMSKAGCSAGACHAKPEGQNGFKLSVFNYDPKSDYAEIVKEGRGRRVFP